QHAGLGENVLDHRLNTRTVRMNAVHRFLYWNMNYHVEHHMFPLVPYHRLAGRPAEIKHRSARAAGVGCAPPRRPSGPPRPATAAPARGPPRRPPDGPAGLVGQWVAA